MKTTRNIFLFLAVVLLWFCASVPEIFADTHLAASCSYSDVNSAISAAAEGDTVSVPPCPSGATWTQELAITKGITFQGAGAGNTVIYGNIPSDTHLWKYSPSNPSNNAAFVVTGFTFNLQSSTLAFRIENPGVYPPITKVRVHDNEFLNLLWEHASKGAAGIEIQGGQVWGVADHNTFTGEFGAHHDSSQQYNWNSYPAFVPGGSDNFFWEDNTITGGGSINGGPAATPMTGSGWGGRYVSRYNTFVYTGQGLFPWYDIHGNSPSGVHGSMGVEIYGNKITSTTIPRGNGIKMFHHRGGIARIYFNKATATAGYISYSFGLQEEYDDSISPTTNTEPEHISDSYYWNNRGDTALITPYVDGDCCARDYSEFSGGPCTHVCSPPIIAKPNVNWWSDGSGGVGCGTLPNRPTTCTTGTAYWATNQSCSSVDDANVGANPTAPISGTLYKCTATNTWTAYYTPYTYPHPLTTGQLLAPNNLRIVP